MATESSSATPEFRLLIVDDDRLVLKIVSEFFTPHGYEVEQARDGAEALRILDRFVPDVIVADVLMPNLDGWDLLEEVQRRGLAPRVPFLFLTTEADLPQRLRGFHMGADDYITKPFHVEELHARVERILRRRGELDPGSAREPTLLSGLVSQLPLSDLLQILALNGKDGMVSLEREGESGVIVFRRGALIHAACGRVRGVKALYRMLGWTGASFRVTPLGETAFPRTVDQPATSVLMDGLVSLDEWNRWRGMLPGEDVTVEVAEDAGERLGRRRLSPAEADVLARADRSATVADILENSPLPDADLAEAVCALISSGVLCSRI